MFSLACSFLPDYRWRAACDLALRRVLPPDVSADDLYIRLALRAIQGRPSKAVAGAMVLRDGPPLPRGEVEGRALAGQPAADIARLMRISAAAVRAHLEQFFDAVGRRNEEQWRYRAVAGTWSAVSDR